MGVIGLTSFMNNSILDDILESVKLDNSILLIDGYSLMHRIYYINNLECIYSGNYDEYANKLDEFFSLFKSCKIEPIFLLDGAKDLNEKKFKTNMKRANQRINNVFILNNYISSTKSSRNKKSKTIPVCPKINLETLMNSTYSKSVNGIMPIMMFNVFKNALDRFEFIYYQCDFEADYDLACLSNELKCPLLSCDSDFYIYDLKYGYISLDYFDMDLKSKIDEGEDSTTKMEVDKEYYFSAKIYKIDKFIEYINAKFDLAEDNLLKKNMLPIFAILCGNDYVERSTFESILKTFDSTNNNLKFKKKNTPNYAKQKKNFYNRILEYVCQFENSNDCLNTMLKFIKSDKHEKVCQIVSESIEDYMCLKPSLASLFKNCIKERLKSKNVDISDEKNMEISCFSNQIKSFDDRFVGSNFLNEYHHCRINRLCLDIILHRKIILNTQIEYLDWPSTYESSIRIRKLFYAILIKNFGFNESSLEPVVVHEYLRLQNQIKIYDVGLDNLKSVLPSVKENSAIFFYKNLLDFEDPLIGNLQSKKFSNFNEKVASLFSVIFYWLKSHKSTDSHESQISNPIKAENYIKGFVVSLIKTLVIDKCYSEIKARNLLDQISTESESIRKYEKKEDEFIIDKYFNKSETHSLVNDLLENKNNYEYMKEIKLKLFPYCQSVFHCSNSNSNKLNKFLNIKLAHSLCEFQAIYFSVQIAQEVFGLVSNNNMDNVKLLELEQFYNGTFLHNFIDELERRSNPDLFIEEFFGRKSFFKHLYYEFIDLFNKMFLLG